MVEVDADDDDDQPSDLTKKTPSSTQQFRASRGRPTRDKSIKCMGVLLPAPLPAEGDHDHDCSRLKQAGFGNSICRFAGLCRRDSTGNGSDDDHLSLSSIREDDA